MLRRFAVILVFLAAASASARAAQAPDPTPALDRTPDTAAEVERLRVEGFAALYSLDYAAAGRAFDEIVRIAPDRPQGYLFRATNTWMRSLYDQRLLSTSLYTRDEFYEQKERAADPAVDKAFRADLQKAISIGERRVAANPKDVEALYYLGAAHGSLAGYEASVARAFISALKHGSKSVDLHEKVVKLDPKFVDAYLSIGMYHYVVGSLPLPVKLMVALGGVTGSKKDGLAELARVVRDGTRNADDARVVLASLYTRERRREDALRMLAELGAKYPTNYVVSLEQANLLVALGRRAEAYAAFDALLATPRAAREATDFVAYAYGEALRSGGEHERSLAAYQKVQAWKGADRDLVTLAHLGAGQCLDALGRRQEALGRYRMVLQRPDVLDSRRRAERLVKSPYAPSQPTAPTGQAASASRQSSVSSSVAGWRAT